MGLDDGSRKDGRVSISVTTTKRRAKIGTHRRVEGIVQNIWIRRKARMRLYIRPAARGLDGSIVMPNEIKGCAIIIVIV